jgi:translation initiation factor IF-1
VALERIQLADSKDVVEATGTIMEAHRGGLFNVDVEIGDTILNVTARPSGKMRKYGIKLVVGDSVKIEVSPYDLTKGRITYRV